jgi:hypothetical protein
MNLSNCRPFNTGSCDKAWSYQDKTDGVVSKLIEQEILQYTGMFHVYEDETVYMQDIIDVLCK